MTEAECHVAPDVCTCNTSDPSETAATIDPNDPAGTPPLVALVSDAMTLRRDHDTLLRIIGNRKVRTLQEGSAVARLALALPADQNHDLLVRVARFVLRLEGERTQ